MAEKNNNKNKESNIIDEIKEKSPVVYQILKEQEQSKWEIIKGGEHLTSESSSCSDEAKLNSYLNAYNL